MKNFKELVGLLGKSHLSIDDTKLGQQANALFLYVRRVANPTDQGAAKKLNLSKSSPAYRKVKHKLKYALLDGITAVTPDAQVPETRPDVSLRCWSSIALARSNPYAYDLLPRNLIDANIQLSQEYDLLEASSLLTDVLADRPSVGPDIVHYLERSDYLGKLGVAMAELYDASFYITLLKSEYASSDKVRAAAISGIKKVNRLNIERFDYIRLYYYKYVIVTNKLIAENNFLETIEEANNALKIIQKKAGSRLTSYSAIFNIYKLHSYIQLEYFQQGVLLAEKLLSELDEKSLNYTKTQELLIFLCLRTNNFQQAYSYFEKYDLKKYGNGTNPYFLETMLIYRAYIGILIVLGVIKPDKDTPSIKLKIGRFINSFEYAQKEKEFRNVQIVLIKLIFSIISYDGNKLFNEVDACKKYVNRHLRKEGLDRSRWIIKALIYSAERGMNTTSVDYVERHYLKKIGELPISEARQHSHIEVVRYDVLWKLILNYFKSR